MCVCVDAPTLNLLHLFLMVSNVEASPNWQTENLCPVSEMASAAKMCLSSGADICSLRLLVLCAGFSLALDLLGCPC